MSDEEQIDRISMALHALDNRDRSTREQAEALFSRGVRVLQLDEVILSRADARLLDMVRQAVTRWEVKKRGPAKVSSDSSDDTFGVKGVHILNALIGAGKPLGRVPAIQAAAGWHRDYQPSPAEWEPWRAAWRTLLIQRRIRRTNNPSLGEESLWEAVPVLLTNSPTELEERRRQNPGLCVTVVMVEPTPAQGTVICGKPEMVVGSGSCGEHGEGCTL